jgi:hypothetical protein
MFELRPEMRVALGVECPLLMPTFSQNLRCVFKFQENRSKLNFMKMVQKFLNRYMWIDGRTDSQRDMAKVMGTFL